MIELLCELACANKMLAASAGVRIKGNVATATDGITMLSVGDFPASHKIDCFVHGESLKSALKIVEKPAFELDSRNLVLKGDKKVAKVPLLDIKACFFDAGLHPEGDFYSSSDILVALDRALDFCKSDLLRSSISSIYLDGQYAYATDSDILVRLDCNLNPVFNGDLISFPRLFAKLATKIESPLVGATISNNRFSLNFEQAWIMTSAKASEAPLDFISYFSEFDEINKTAVTDEIGKELKAACKNMPLESTIDFSETGTSLEKENGLRVLIEHVFPFTCKTKIGIFKKALPYLKQLGLSRSTLAFVGEGIAGHMGVL